MWQTSDNYNSNAASTENIHFNNSTIETNKIQNFCQNDSVAYSDVIKANLNEIGTQAVAIQSEYSIGEYHKRKNDIIEPQVDCRSKRGRGRGSRGSYKPRGRARFVGGSMSNSYGVTTQLPRVCVNPEILKILDCSDYYYQNVNNNTTNNNNNNNRGASNYGMQMIVDSSSATQTVYARNNNNEILQHQHATSSNQIPNYIVMDSNQREIFNKHNELQFNNRNSYENNIHPIYRPEMDKYYYYQIEQANNNDETTQEFISEDKLNGSYSGEEYKLLNRNNLENPCNTNNNNNNNNSYLVITNNDNNENGLNNTDICYNKNQKSILDISNPNQHHLIELEHQRNNQLRVENDVYATNMQKYINGLETYYQNQVYQADLNQNSIDNQNFLLSNHQIDTTLDTEILSSQSSSSSSSSSQSSSYKSNKSVNYSMNNNNYNNHLLDAHNQQYLQAQFSKHHNNYNNNNNNQNKINYSQTCESINNIESHSICSLPPVSTVLHGRSVNNRDNSENSNNDSCNHNSDEDNSYNKFINKCDRETDDNNCKNSALLLQSNVRAQYENNDRDNQYILINDDDSFKCENRNSTTNNSIRINQNDAEN